MHHNLAPNHRNTLSDFDLLDEKSDEKILASFFKKAAEKSAKNDPDSVLPSDFFQIKETPADKALHDAWMGYVTSIKNNEPQQKIDIKFKKFFKPKYFPLLKNEHKKWFSGAEKHFKAAKIFKHFYDKYDFCLMSTLPKNGEPAHNKIYFSKIKNGELEYCIHSYSPATFARATRGRLNFPIEEELTLPFLNSHKAEIFELILKKVSIPSGQKAFDKYLTLRPQETELIPKITITGEDLCFSGYENYKYYLTKLDSAEPVAACLGKKTNCCQSLLHPDGEERVIYGIEKANSGFYVICEMKGATPNPAIDDIVLQTWAWREGDFLGIDAPIPLAQTSEGRIPGRTCQNIDIWIAFFQHLANRIVTDKSYGILKVSVRMNETPIRNMGISGRNLCKVKDCPTDYFIRPWYRDDPRVVRGLMKHQMLLAFHDTPLHILYALSNTKLSLTPSDRANLEDSFCRYINTEQGFVEVNNLINNWKINDAYAEDGPQRLTIEALHTFYSICNKLPEQTQIKMLQLLDTFFKKNESVLFNSAFNSTSLIIGWWFQHSTFPLETKFDLLLKKSNNIEYYGTVNNYIRSSPTLLLDAINNGKLEIVKWLIYVDCPLNEQHLIEACERANRMAYTPAKPYASILKYLLEKAEKSNLSVTQELRKKLNEVLYPACDMYENRDAKELIEYLVKNKLVDLEYKQYGITALLMVASGAQHNKWELVCFLVEHGANPHLKYAGFTVFDFAKKAQQDSVLAFLDQHRQRALEEKVTHLQPTDAVIHLPPRETETGTKVPANKVNSPTQGHGTFDLRGERFASQTEPAPARTSSPTVHSCRYPLI